MDEITDTPIADATAATPLAPGEPAPLAPAPAPAEPAPAELAKEPAGPEAAGEPASPPRKGRSKLFYILAGVLGTIGIIAVLCLGATITGSFLIGQASGEVTPVLTEFMQDLEAGEIAAAYAMMSEAGKQQVSLNQLSDFAMGSGREYIRGFESLSVQTINRSVVANTNPDVVQGDVAIVQAVLQYEDGSTGILNATLQKIDGRWLIAGAHIQRSPAPEQIEKPTTG